MINIYTVKWGTKYGPEYVNKILEQCKKYTKQEFKFYCLTEDPTSLSSDIEVIPFPEDNYYEKWWNKLYLFDKNVVTQTGEKLFFDLDIFIQHSIDPIISHACGDSLTFIKTELHNLEQMRIDTKEIPRKFTERSVTSVLPTCSRHVYHGQKQKDLRKKVKISTRFESRTSLRATSR